MRLRGRYVLSLINFHDCRGRVKCSWNTADLDGSLG